MRKVSAYLSAYDQQTAVVSESRNTPLEFTFLVHSDSLFILNSFLLRLTIKQDSNCNLEISLALPYPPLHASFAVNSFMSLKFKSPLSPLFAVCPYHCLLYSCCFIPWFVESQVPIFLLSADRYYGISSPILMLC